MFKRFLPYFNYMKPVRGQFIIAVLSGVVAAWASGFGLPLMISKVFPIVFDNKKLPEFLQNFFTNYFPEYDTHQIVLMSVCALMPLIFIVRGIAGYINVYYISYVGMRVLEFLRLDVFKRIQKLPLAFHEKQKRGDILSRIMGDTAGLQQLVTTVCNDLMLQPMTLIGALSFLVYTCVTSEQSLFLLINLGFVGVAVLPIHFFGKRLLGKSRKLAAEAGDMTATVQENLAAQRDIRAYKLEAVQTERLHRQILRIFALSLQSIKYRQFLVPTIEIVCAIGIAVALYKGSQDGMTQGDFIALATALYMSYDPLKKLGMVHNRIKAGQASLERLEYIMNQPDDMSDPINPIPLPNITGDVRFEDVSFAYDGSNYVLKNVSAHFPPGQVIALVGPSGSGKTTFISLIPRFYEALKGGVLVDGIDIRNVTKSELRDGIALISQHPILFRDTIMENIRLGKLDATDEEVMHAAKLAACEDFIASMPGGYNYMVGEGGEGLSGGQRQRISIARAFLKDAPILIMDEATASLDADSEYKIQNELATLVKGRTTFIIAHRFSTIRIADRILVMCGGEVVADGSHEEIYPTCALYRELYDKQSLV